jgi:hypothetical protein
MPSETSNLSAKWCTVAAIVGGTAAAMRAGSPRIDLPK